MGAPAQATDHQKRECFAMMDILDPLCHQKSIRNWLRDFGSHMFPSGTASAPASTNQLSASPDHPIKNFVETRTSSSANEEPTNRIE
jgi:hypothetical protein